jgi:hypothetical protein
MSALIQINIPKEVDGVDDDNNDDNDDENRWKRGPKTDKPTRTEDDKIKYW